MKAIWFIVNFCSIGDSFVFGFTGLARDFLFCVRGNSYLLSDFVSGIGIADAAFVFAIFFGFPSGALGTDFRCVSSIFLSYVIGVTLS